MKRAKAVADSGALGSTAPSVRDGSMGRYAADTLPLPLTGGAMTVAREDQVIALALDILAQRSMRSGTYLRSPFAVRRYLQLKLGLLPHEVFVVVFMTADNQVLAMEEMFRGTLTQASVYPREIVKRALELNAGAVLFAHNHPSGSVEPSAADRSLTRLLADALALIDVRTLDHLIVAGTETTSFAERGLLD